MNFSELDETMQKHGFYTNLDDGLDQVDIAFSGVIYYLCNDGINRDRIEFQTRRETGIPEYYNDEITIDIIPESITAE